MARRLRVWNCLAEHVLLMDRKSAFNLKIEANQHPVERCVPLTVQTFLLYLSEFVLFLLWLLLSSCTLLRNCMPVNLRGPVQKLSSLRAQCLAVSAVHRAVVVYREGQSIASHRLLRMVKVQRRAVRTSWKILKLEEFWTAETARSVDITS